jgi:uncharacterized membrane-anchored protein YitT (DUF2179 family)
MPAQHGDEFNPTKPHSGLEDAYALFVGCALVTLGLVLLKAAHLVTGGLTGVALLLSYFIPLPVGLIFALFNVPFFLFAEKALGRRFMGRTIVVNAAIMSLSAAAPLGIHLQFVSPVVAALGGGTAIGMGVLALARHGAGVGGSGVLSPAVKEKRLECRANSGRDRRSCTFDVAYCSTGFTHGLVGS